MSQRVEHVSRLPLFLPYTALHPSVQLAEALAAVHAQAAEASVAVAARDAGAGARAAFNDATSAFVSPFNIRVPAKGPGIGPGPAGASRSGARQGPGMAALLQIVEAHRATGGLNAAASGFPASGPQAGGQSFIPGPLPSPMASDNSLLPGGRSVAPFTFGGQRGAAVAGAGAGVGGGSSRERFDPGVAAAVAGVAAATTAAAAGVLAPLALGGRRGSHGGGAEEVGLGGAGEAGLGAGDDDDATTGIGAGIAGAGATSTAAAHAADDDEDGGVPNRADLKRQAQRLLRRVGAAGAGSGSGSPIDTTSGSTAGKNRAGLRVPSPGRSGDASHAHAVVSSSAQRTGATGTSSGSTASLVAQLAEHAAASLAATRSGSAGALPVGKGSHAAAGMGRGHHGGAGDALGAVPPGYGRSSAASRGATGSFSASDGLAAAASMPTLPLTRSQLQRALATGRGGRRGAV